MQSAVTDEIVEKLKGITLLEASELVKVRLQKKKVFFIPCYVHLVQCSDGLVRTKRMDGNRVHWMHRLDTCALSLPSV